MAIDPTDDCTFWYTANIRRRLQVHHWSTRIASFSFPSCTQSYTLTVNEVGQGTVTSADGEINCANGSGTCSAIYSSGSSVTLTGTRGERLDIFGMERGLQLEAILAASS